MFGTFLKRRPIKVTAMTRRADLISYAPVAKSTEFIPKWWRNLPSSYTIDDLHDASTMRFCTGITDLYSKGLIIPLWSDFNIQIGHKGTAWYKYQFADKISRAYPHDIEQRGSFAEEYEWQHLQFVSPWRFTCDGDVDFLMTTPIWHLENPPPYTILPGVLNFKQVFESNINTIFERKEDTKLYSLKLRDPFCHLVPLTDRKIELTLKLISEEEFQNFSNSKGIPLKFIGDAVYKRAVSKKTNLKCPIYKG